ncbi:MAG: hypothetical protein KDA93_04415 [Planctomycetaceae bacterium]|nr:hypothetical protein [Planctomycetaceae bacterium]
MASLVVAGFVFLLLRSPPTEGARRPDVAVDIATDEPRDEVASPVEATAPPEIPVERPRSPLGDRVFVSPDGLKPGWAQEGNASLETATSQVVSVLESQDYVTFLRDFAPVDKLREARTTNGGIEEAARRMHQESGQIDVLLQRLKQCSTTVPMIDSAGGTAVFVLGSDDDPMPAENGPTSEASAEQPVPGLGRDIKQVLRGAIELLNKGEREEFVRKLFPASEVRRMIAEDSFGSTLVILDQHPEMVAAMISDLELMETLTPSKRSGESLEYELPPAVETESPRVVQWELTDGHWRFIDNSQEVRKQILELAARVPSDSESPNEVRWERIGQQWRLQSMTFE